MTDIHSKIARGIKDMTDALTKAGYTVKHPCGRFSQYRRIYVADEYVGQFTYNYHPVGRRGKVSTRPYTLEAPRLKTRRGTGVRRYGYLSTFMGSATTNCVVLTDHEKNLKTLQTRLKDQLAIGRRFQQHAADCKKDAGVILFEHHISGRNFMADKNKKKLELQVRYYQRYTADVKTIAETIASIQTQILVLKS